ncbi:hypothetical protein Q7P37_001294 [Cladosporium fusiforme]
MSSPISQPPWDLTALTDKISYFRPPPPENPKPDSVSLIVLCSWMSANRKHIAKYTQQYRHQHPGAAILVLETSVSDVFETSLSEIAASCAAKKHKQLAPAREIILSHLTAPDHARQRIVLHVFSNGGAACATTLVSSLPAEQRLRAFNAIVFDSCPGEATYQRSVHAFSLSLPKHPLAQIIGLPLVHFMICMFGLVFFLFSAENFMARIRRQLNEPALFAVEVPRLYVFSHADKLVLSRDVASHAADARRKGYLKVSELPFENSAHCAHAMAHGEQYWAAVDRVISESVLQ